MLNSSDFWASIKVDKYLVQSLTRTILD